MNKFLYIFFILLFSCSLNPNSAFWSKTEKAKSLLTIWNLSKQERIFKAISLVTKDATLSLYPDTRLNWFNLEAFQVLLLADEIEAAKKWIFYGTSSIRERAGIDIDFCKLLIMLYIYDDDARQSLKETVNIDLIASSESIYENMTKKLNKF